MATRRITRSRVSARFDLNELLKRTQSDRAVRRALRPFIKRSDIKREFGQQVIEEILDRLDQGQGKDGAFTGRAGRYSKSYRESPSFQFLKGGQSTVNLKLTGQMRSFLEILGTDETGVTIGISDSEEAAKAHGHITGGRYLPVRDFLGLPDKRQIQIFENIISDFETAALQQAAEEEAQSLTIIEPAADAGLAADIAAGAEVDDFLLGASFFGG